jgi:hypothetical protein
MPQTTMADGIGFSDARGVDLPLSECQQLAGYFSLGPMQEEKDDDGETDVQLGPAFRPRLCAALARNKECSRWV